MTDKDDAGAPEEDRTVFRPASAPPATPPGGAGSAGAPPPPAGAQVASTPPPMGATFIPMAPRTGTAQIQVGDVLNHIFEVKRFIARGGMGEVFEGCNVNSDERVAIKVMLPALAADPSVQAMFRKEARTLTRLSHPALVAYRVLAQEPQLGVFYIVTEYIDGANLSDVLGQLKPSAAELLALTRRLADGLRAAHALGAIHRDMSPDNVLLENGKLSQARVIDFGIAKDLDPSAKTIIGEGFAGKLGYVAPEQLGDFDREVGPWSDVYSLGLVVLAVALGRDVGMGSNFVEAVDRRRKGVDLSGAPAELRPVLERMLKPNPAERLRSMDEVIAAVDQALAPPVAPTAQVRPAPPPVPPIGRDGGSTDGGGSNRTLLIGGAAGAALLLAVGGYIAFGGSGADHAPPAPAAPPGVTSTAADANKPAAVARTAIAKVLPGLECTWLDVTNVTQTADGIAVALAGVAGRPAEAQAVLSKAVTDAGLPLASADFADVAPITGTECGTIDALRAIRSDGPPHLSTPQRKFEMSRMPADSNYAGKIGARAVVNINLKNDVPDLALYGIEPNGAISSVVPDRKAFDEYAKPGGGIANLGNGSYRLQIDSDHSGWSGIILLTGKSGFSDKLVVAGPGQRTAEWRQRFAEAAKAGDWKAEMVWYKDVDETPD